MNGSDRAVPPDLVSDIRSRIKGRVAIVGMGNIMRADDGLGCKLIELLKGRAVNARLFDCGTAPENYIFPILSSSCDTIVLVDAADTADAPGTARVLDLDQISTFSFSTHMPSPRLFTDLLKTGREDLAIFVVSVQPKHTTLGGNMSAEVLEGLGILADIFAKALA